MAKRKGALLTVRLTQQELDDYKAFCEAKGSNMSEQVKQFIYKELGYNRKEVNNNGKE